MEKERIKLFGKKEAAKKEKFKFEHPDFDKILGIVNKNDTRSNAFKNHGRGKGFSQPVGIGNGSSWDPAPGRYRVTHDFVKPNLGNLNGVINKEHLDEEQATQKK